MILNGNQRGGAKDLALHLMKTENERVELHELRGVMSHDLMGALNEMYAVSRGTRCEQFLYSLSLNPPKDKVVSVAEFMQAIEMAEKRLGLGGQPRAVVFHEKHGRRHCHVVWSRIDITRMKAVQLSHDREKLTALSRELFVTHGWNMPHGLEVRGERSSLNYTHAEYQQAQRVNKNAAEIKAEIQAAWAASDNRASLEAALAERGYVLAKGDRRDFVVVDKHGEVYSLPRFAGVKAKEVRARLGDGADLPSVAQVTAQWSQEPPAVPVQEYTAEDALARITRHHAAFTPEMMDHSLTSIMTDDTQRQAMIAEILQLDEVVKIGKRNGRDVYASRDMIALEQRMAELAQDMTRTPTHKTDDSIIDMALYNLNDSLIRLTGGRASLSHEQERAIRHMASDRQMALVVGIAGAGKTTIMEGAKEAWETQGYRVRGAAPSGVAASNLKSIGIQASTLHSLEARIQLAKQMMDDNADKPLTQKQSDFIQSAMLSDKDVLIVDEAGMIPAAQLARIMELVKQSGAKLVLVGDPAQLQSVEAGAAFRTLLERNEFVSLTEVRRQSAGWQRTATHYLAQGKIGQALSSYQANGCLHRGDTRSDAKAQLVADVMQAQETKPELSRLVLAYTRQDVNDLNAMIKAERMKRGYISDTGTEVSVTVKEADSEHEETQSFAVGDRILFRENNRDLGVMNGSFGTLKAIEDEQFHVTLDNGNTVRFSPQEYTRFQLGYAATVHQSQGITVDQAFVLATPHFDRHSTYVAMSRHKDQVKIYASKKDFPNHATLHRRLGRESNKLSTLDFTGSMNNERTTSQTKTDTLRQQDIITIREEFIRRTRSKSHEQSLDQVRDFNLPRNQTPVR